MFTVYILYSKEFNRIYVGYTSNLEQRLLSHNMLAKKGTPLEILHTEVFESKSEAIAREKQLKSATGREFIRKQLLKQ